MQWLRENAIAIAFCLPLVLFFLVPGIVPHESVEGPGGIEAQGFLWMTAIRVLVMAAAIVVFWKITSRQFPLQIDLWGPVVGVLGGVLWIGICALGIEQTLLVMIGLSEDALGARTGVNPFELYGEDSTRLAFLVARFSLLVVCVPIAEEFFLRGFFMRAVDSSDWEELSLGKMGWTGLAAGTVYGMLTHPSEFVAAAVWFSLVTVLMVRTGKFWNCVLAHAITNAMLGVYILRSGHWELW